MNFRKKIIYLSLGLSLLGLPMQEDFLMASPPSKVKAKNSSSQKKGNTGGQNTVKPKTSAEAKKRREEAQKEIKLTEEQIRQNDLEVKRNLTELGKIEGDITQTKTKISSLNKKLNTLTAKISSLETTIGKNEEELDKLREEYLKAVKKMRVSKKNRSDLAFVFSSSSFNQALRRMRYLKEFSSWKERQTEEINGKISELKKEKDDLSQARKEEQSTLKEQKDSEAKLLAQHKRQEAVVADLKSNGSALQSHLKKKQSEADELGGMISQLIASEEQQRREEERARQEAERKAAEERERALAAEEAARKAEEEKESTLAMASAPQDKKKEKAEKKEAEKQQKEERKRKQKEEKAKKQVPTKEEEAPKVYADARKRAPRSTDNSKVKNTEEKVSGNFADMRGKLPKPVNGSFTVTSRFGKQSLPELPDVVYDNPGIDAEVAAGSSAYAVFKGKVSGVYLLPGYNTVVIVNHDGYYTVYGNISTPSVKVGDSVEMGQGLGRLALNEEDNTHSSIHFEVWKNREKMNPLEWIRN